MDFEDDHTLQNHHVVLGKYAGGKTKVLTPATEIYKKVRSQVRRSGNLSAFEVLQIKRAIKLLLQEKLGIMTDAADIIFCVDVKKAEDAGKLDDFGSEHPQLLMWGKSDSFSDEQTFFVPDTDDFFLRLDLEANKKRDSVKVSSPEKKKINRILKAKWNEAAEAELGSLCGYMCNVVQPSESMDHTSLTTESFFEQPMLALKKSSSALSLEDQIEVHCGQWICSDSSSVETIKRKTELTDTYKAYVSRYQKILSAADPLRNASVQSGLRGLSETLLVEVANQIFKAMVSWYELYPKSCLVGEENSWVKELNNGSTAFDNVGCCTTSDDDMAVEEFSDGSLMKMKSVGYFSGIDDDIQLTLSDDEGITLATHYLEDFTFSSGSGEKKEVPPRFASDGQHFKGLKKARRRAFSGDEDDPSKPPKQRIRDKVREKLGEIRERRVGKRVARQQLQSNIA